MNSKVTTYYLKTELKITLVKQRISNKMFNTINAYAFFLLFTEHYVFIRKMGSPYGLVLAVN
jgi:hypothetical protein